MGACRSGPSSLSVATRPDVSRPCTYSEGEVASVLARWILSGALSTVFDTIALTLSISLVWDL
jgi:hypothetical protein